MGPGPLVRELDSQVNRKRRRYCRWRQFGVHAAMSQQMPRTAAAAGSQQAGVGRVAPRASRRNHPCDSSISVLWPPEL